MISLRGFGLNTHGKFVAFVSQLQISTNLESANLVCFVRDLFFKLLQQLK